VLGDGPARDYLIDQARWRAAAARLLERHTLERLSRAFEQMLADEVIGSRALTLPAFEKVVDQLIARHHARARASRPGAAHPSTPDGLDWSAARQQLERAVQRHGRDQRDQALAELAACDLQLVEFVERVRWSTLCEQPMQFAERRYAELWSEIASRHQREETAA